MEKKLNKKNKLLWSLVSVLIAGVSVWAVTAQNKNFSLKEFFSFAVNSNWGWLVAAVCGMLGFILFEAAAILTVCKSFGYRRKKTDGFFYSASDIYFSAITPSATGGQPACAYFMMRDGIPGMLVTVALIANLAMYTLSIIVIGAVCFIVKSNLLSNFSTVSVVLIIIGFVAQLSLLVFFMLLLRRKKLLSKLCHGAVKFLRKLHLIKQKRADKWLTKLSNVMEEYENYTALLKGKKMMLFKLFIYNLLQRVSQIAVTMFVFLAAGGALGTAPDIWFLQSFVVLGTNCLPIPGAMGITDFLMLDCFKSIMNADMATNLELLSRSISFYSCIIICGIAVVIKYILCHRRDKKLQIKDN